MGSGAATGSLLWKHEARPEAVHHSTKPERAQKQGEALGTDPAFFACLLSAALKPGRGHHLSQAPGHTQRAGWRPHPAGGKGHLGGGGLHLTVGALRRAGLASQGRGLAGVWAMGMGSLCPDTVETRGCGLLSHDPQF